MILGSAMAIVFQSTLSMRRATSRRGHGVASRIFQSTLSMRRATIEGMEARETHDISIHALHEESDNLLSSLVIAKYDFNPRSP